MASRIPAHKAALTEALDGVAALGARYQQHLDLQIRATKAIDAATSKTMLTSSKLQETLGIVSKLSSIVDNIETISGSAQQVSDCWSSIDSASLVSIDAIETGATLAQDVFLEILSLGL
jgi:hypothetical protein